MAVILGLSNSMLLLKLENVTTSPYSYSEELMYRNYVTHTERALDIGCGKGHFTRLLSTTFSHVHAIDINPARIAALRDALKMECLLNVELSCVSANDLPSPSNPYSAAFFSNSFGHISDRVGALDRCVSVLMEKGILYIKEEELSNESLPVLNFLSLRELAEDLCSTLGEGDGMCEVRLCSMDEAIFICTESDLRLLESKRVASNPIIGATYINRLLEEVSGNINRVLRLATPSAEDLAARWAELSHAIDSNGTAMPCTYEPVLEKS
jgi:SAM-dependent methyltransferase